jgi:TctA family transporter
VRGVDRGVGLGLTLLALVVLFTARAFPDVPGQKLGASFLPMLVGAGLLLCGLALVARSRHAPAAGSARGVEQVLPAVIVMAAVAGYVLLAERLGFLIVAPLLLLSVFKALQVGWRAALLWALGGTVVVHGVPSTDPMDVLQTAFGLVFQPDVLLVIALSALYGLFVGAIPGLTATMATALLVPVTFFMAPVPAVAAIVTATAMAIFSGDIPSALLRMPGTPASAAYTDEAYLLTKSGRAELALGSGLVFSVLGGIFGVVVLIVAAPALAEVALKFSSFEYFWLVMLGFTCAIFIAGADPLKGTVSLLLGLLVACVGLENPAGAPRWTFGNAELMGGIPLIPLMIGMFAVSEVLRFATSRERPEMAIDRPFGNVFSGMWALIKKYPVQLLRGSALGTAVGALPGAGADIAAWMSYGISKRFSKEPEKFGTGHVEGIVESGAANNSALGGAWIPALVFGIPGDSITAIAIGVLYLKNMNPGPTLFVDNPQNIYAVFIVFIAAQILMLPFGFLAIKVAKQILRIPAAVLMPLILLFCVVGSFAINNSMFGVIVMGVAGVIAFFMERWGFPVAPTILGVVLGTMLEEHFFSSLVKADGNLLAFFQRPIAAALGVVTLLIWLWPLYKRLLPRRTS